MKTQTQCPLTATEYVISNKYGIMLDDNELADLLKQKKHSIQQLRSNGDLPITCTKVYLHGNKRGRPMYDFREVARWWDSARTDQSLLGGQR